MTPPDAVADPLTQAEDVIAETLLRPVWDDIVAGRGHLCPVCQRSFGSALALLTHQTAARHWRRESGSQTAGWAAAASPCRRPSGFQAPHPAWRSRTVREGGPNRRAGWG